MSMQSGFAAGTGGILCGHCGRPMAAGVSIGGRMYHHECTHGPGGPLKYEPTPPGTWAQCAPVRYMTEQEVREVVRDELKKSGLLNHPNA